VTVTARTSRTSSAKRMSDILVKRRSAKSNSYNTKTPQNGCLLYRRGRVSSLTPKLHYAPRFDHLVVLSTSTLKMIADFIISVRQATCRRLFVRYAKRTFALSSLLGLPLNTKKSGRLIFVFPSREYTYTELARKSFDYSMRANLKIVMGW